MIHYFYTILGGPLLLVIILYGCVMDFISYDDIICNTGCPLSSLFSDLHKICLLFVSLILFKELLEIKKEKIQDLSEPFITWTVASIEEFEKNEICVICREQTDSDIAAVRNQACQHLFHERCIKSWVLIKRECPICRKEFF